MSPSSNAEFPMHRVHEVSKSPGKRLHQADVRLQAPKYSFLPADLGAWPGFCRQVPCSGHPASARFSYLQFLLRFRCLSYIQLTSQFPFHLLYLCHRPSLVYHFTCSTGSIKDAVRTSPYPWFDKEETEACDHKAMQWPSWALTPIHFMLSGEKRVFLIHLCHQSCAGHKGSTQ